MTFLFRKATSMDTFLVPQTTDSDADADNDATAPTDSDAADPDEDSDATGNAEWSVEPLTDLAGCPQLSGADRWMEAARMLQTPMKIAMLQRWPSGALSP